MPRACSVCTHPATADISKAIALGGSKRDVAARFGVTDASVLRHKTNCLRQPGRPKPTEPVATPIEPPGSARFESDDPKTLISTTTRLVDEALSLLEHAKKASDHRTALAALREARDGLALLMRAAGMLGNDGAQINIDARRQSIALLDGRSIDDLLALKSTLKDAADSQTLSAAEPVQ